jgi:hypothetical protein
MFKLIAVLALILIAVVCSMWYSGSLSPTPSPWWVVLILWLVVLLGMCSIWLLGCLVPWGLHGKTSEQQKVLARWGLRMVWLTATTVPCLLWFWHKVDEWAAMKERAAGWWILWGVCFLCTTASWVVWCFIGWLATALLAVLG